MGINSAQRLKDLAVSETGFVFDPYSGATFTTNATGLGILEALKAGADRAQLLAQLREAFDVHQTDDLDRDLDEFLGLLRRYEIVAPSYEPGSTK